MEKRSSWWRAGFTDGRVNLNCRSLFMLGEGMANGPVFS